MSRKITAIENLFICQVLREVNGRPVMCGTEWCRSYRRQGGKHSDCIHFQMCLTLKNIREKLANGIDILETDFEIKKNKGDQEPENMAF